MIPQWPDLVLMRLPLGRDHAITLSELAERMGTSRRVIEKSIEALRLRGEAVCTGSDGAWVSHDAAELRQHADRLRSRAVTVLLGARALRATARRHSRVQQLGMDL